MLLKLIKHKKKWVDKEKHKKAYEFVFKICLDNYTSF